MDWDRGAVTSLAGGAATSTSTSSYDLTRRCVSFLRGFREDTNFVYRTQLTSHVRRSHLLLEIELRDLTSYDPELGDMVLTKPATMLPLLEAAAGQVAKGTTAHIQVVLKSASLEALRLRDIHATQVNRLVKVPGIIISASKVRAKCMSVTVQCKNCSHIKKLPCMSAFGGVSLPRNCERKAEQQSDGTAIGGVLDEDCPKDSYIIVPDKCEYVDQQTLKLQESPEVVPTGEMPRNLLLACDRYLVDRAPPGTRVSILGISSVFNSGAKRQVGAVAIRTPYLRVVGIEIDEEGAGRARAVFTPSEEEKFHEMARDPQLYEKLATSIAPSIYGDYTVNIKKAIACLLIGGSRKRLPDGMIVRVCGLCLFLHSAFFRFLGCVHLFYLRGDINVLLLGDPSTAKSQFLKFTEKVAPVGVYTSGKGSSAAGLTASVIKDAKGEFFLEGGAMVLADGGVVCIDEFDKMRESDRVAIHEAMEQQTISIAKAGITTILNSRASVLAAANPVFGRYDDMRSASDNIDLMSTILSRFDMIFIVRDIQDDTRDRQMAAHVVKVHTNSLQAQDEKQGEIEPWLMKKFITYCRTRCAPRLGIEATQALQDFYVSVRDEVRTQTQEATIPITVRQLEALVRISESLAKMQLKPTATVEHVYEAIRMFRVSTMNAAKDGGTQGMFGGFHEKAQEVEASILRTVQIGTRVETHALYSKLESQGHNPNAIQRAIRGMVQKGSLKQMNQFKYVVRAI
ncbi:DNA replication licensing factor MCM5 [Achlya hypogyna]|uniref:DNA replication licensing factor MCM5 n=1 Tax=Achlya hypogyna TaxID=1202772 RepID=A0A1V9YME0_ACHHY|nr:DNA replication licensing factor MCM5 [Achlya hypogyna]